MDKIRAHQSQTPLRVLEYRKDVPPRVAVIVERLMAKRPEDRFGAAYEVATVMEQLVKARKTTAATTTFATATASPPPATPRTSVPEPKRRGIRRWMDKIRGKT